MGNDSLMQSQVSQQSVLDRFGGPVFEVKSSPLGQSVGAVVKLEGRVEKKGSPCREVVVSANERWAAAAMSKRMALFDLHSKKETWRSSELSDVILILVSELPSGSHSTWSLMHIMVLMVLVVCSGSCGLGCG